MAAAGLIALDIPWPFQPGFPVRPKEKWLLRRLSFASRLSDSSNSITGIPESVTGTKADGDYRAFGSTLGVGTTDMIVSSQVGSISTGRTYIARFKRNGAGGGGFGRICDRTSGATACESFAWNGTQVQFQWNVASGTNDQWTFPATAEGGATAGREYVVAIAYTASNRSITAGWINGARQVLTNSSVGAGTPNSLPSEALVIGSRSAGDRAWDGLLADFAVFDAILNPDEVAELSRPGGLWEGLRIWVPVSAGGGAFKAAWARNSNSVIGAGVSR